LNSIKDVVYLVDHLDVSYVEFVKDLDGMKNQDQDTADVIIHSDPEKMIHSDEEDYSLPVKYCTPEIQETPITAAEVSMHAYNNSVSMFYASVR